MIESLMALPGSLATSKVSPSAPSCPKRSPVGTGSLSGHSCRTRLKTNTIISYGGAGKIRTFNPYCDVVWDRHVSGLITALTRACVRQFRHRPIYLLKQITSLHIL